MGSDVTGAFYTAHKPKAAPLTLHSCHIAVKFADTSTNSVCTGCGHDFYCYVSFSLVTVLVSWM